MKIVQEFTVARPRPVISAYLSDVPVVARCLPAAEITEDKGGGDAFRQFRPRQKI